MEAFVLSVSVDNEYVQGLSSVLLEDFFSSRKDDLYRAAMRAIQRSPESEMHYFKFIYRQEHIPSERQTRLTLNVYSARAVGIGTHIHEAPQVSFVPVRSNVFPQNPMAHFFEEPEETPMRAIER
jgi:hypothetical protein